MRLRAALAVDPGMRDELVLAHVGLGCIPILRFGTEEQKRAYLVPAIRGEKLGSQPCDGLICCTPSGSTAYNLSNGGPVMMWGLEAMAITFVAPHSLHARPLVLPRGHDLNVTNRSAAQHVSVLVDGKSVGDLAPGAGITVSIGEETASLAVLPEVSFFTRYHSVFP